MLHMFLKVPVTQKVSAGKTSNFMRPKRKEIQNAQYLKAYTVEVPCTALTHQHWF